jgi:hypothetical protein
MFYNTQCCAPTYLVTNIENANLTFRTVPTLLNGSVVKFRIAESITDSLPAGVAITATVNVNGTPTPVPLTDVIGNAVRTGDSLRTRTVYTAVFGSDANHLQIVKVNGKSCLGI